MPRPVPPEGRWIDRHRLVSFYADDELLALIEREMKRTGESKTQVIVNTLAASLTPPSRRRSR